MRFETRWLTPQRAATLLSLHQPVRPLVPGRADAYAQLMAAGLWVQNGMPLILSASGRVLDGHHRLVAARQSGAGFPALLAWQVPDETAAIIDQHRRRGIAALLQARGAAQPKALEAMLTLLVQHHDGTLGQRAEPPAWARLDRILRANPGLLTLRPEPPWPESLALILPFLASRADPTSYGRLRDAFADPGVPAQAAAGALLRQALREGPARPNPARDLALAIIAWNAEAEGKPLGKLAWQTGSPSPSLAGYAPLPGADWPPSPMAASTTPPVDCAPAFTPVSPEMARGWLRDAAGLPPPLLSHVAALAREMQAGRWARNPQPLCFARSGRLLNGQHRLLAVLRAGVTVEMAVLRDLEDAAADTYDLQPRAEPVAAAAPGFGDAPLVTAMANLLWQHEIAPPGSRRRKATPAELRDILAANPGLLELRSLARRLVDYGRPAVLGYAAHVILREDAALGAEFLRRLDGTVPEAPDQPVARLRRQLLALRRSGAAREAALRAVLTTWRQFRARPAAPLRAAPATKR